MRDIAIRSAHPSLILWYSYFDVRRAVDADARWRDLVWAAHGPSSRAQRGEARPALTSGGR
jgi:hypothetical protein